MLVKWVYGDDRGEGVIRLVIDPMFLNILSPGQEGFTPLNKKYATSPGIQVTVSDYIVLTEPWARGCVMIATGPNPVFF